MESLEKTSLADLHLIFISIYDYINRITYINKVIHANHKGEKMIVPHHPRRQNRAGVPKQ